MKIKRVSKHVLEGFPTRNFFILGILIIWVILLYSPIS
jgi:hypothetical protein